MLELSPLDGGKKLATTVNADGEHVLETKEYKDPVQPILISQFLDLDGNGDGVSDFITDYSLTNDDIAYIQPLAGEVFHITRLIVSIQDGNNTLKATTYGGLSLLGVGVEVRIQDNSGTILSLTHNSPIKYNAAWGMFCYDVEVKTWGSGDDLLLSRWSFSKSNSDIQLIGSNFERLEVLLHDDFSGLVHHRFMVQGYMEV